MSTSDAKEPRAISAHACAVLSVVIGVGSIWAVLSVLRDGGDWVFSVLACFVPLMFAAQGLRMSREPEAKYPRFSFVTSIAGGVIGIASFALFLSALSR